jgi:hypothetical protein
MSNQSVIDGTKLDLSLITFGKINRLANGSKSVRVSYNNGPLTIQTPIMSIPWGVNPPYSEKDKKDDDAPIQPSADGKGKMSKWSLQMSFKGVDPKSKDPNTQRLNKFLDNMRALDKLFINKVVENRKEWFDDDEEMTTAEAGRFYNKLYSKAIKERSNKTTKESYPPSIDPKVNCVDGEFQCNVFSMSGEKYDKPIDKLNLKGTSGIGILRLTNFYIQQSRCGPTWTMMRLRADETAALGDFGFVDFDEEENSEGKPKAKANVGINDSDDEDEEVKNTNKGGNAEDDSDEEDTKPSKKESEEEEDSDEEEPEPEPVPVVKKGAKKPATTTTKKK